MHQRQKCQKIVFNLPRHQKIVLDVFLTFEMGFPKWASIPFAIFE